MIYNDICSECQEKCITGLKVFNGADSQIEMSLSKISFLLYEENKPD
jgi:hypothetical protein